MNANTLSFQARRYSVTTDAFDGPLDLLLSLIEKAELDITTIALAQITDQYLVYMSQIDELYPAEISAFLVVAARLLQIKSEALLPKPNIKVTEEEDDGELLIQQLLAYKQYKNIAKLLAEREHEHLTSYLRLAKPSSTASSEFSLDRVDLHQLAVLVMGIFYKDEGKLSLQTIVSMPKITIREKIEMIHKLLRDNSEFNFYKIINDINSRIEIVVTFLAVLELIKRDLLLVFQQGLFGEITIKTGDGWINGQEIELEFGE